MRLAVFTNQFPTKVSTFFSRDMRVLQESGFDIDVFPFYPCDPNLWRYVPSILDDKVFPRNKFHHISIAQSLYCAMRPPFRKLRIFLWDAAAISASALNLELFLYRKAYTFIQRRGRGLCATILSMTMSSLIGVITQRLAHIFFIVFWIAQSHIQCFFTRASISMQIRFIYEKSFFILIISLLFVTLTGSSSRNGMQIFIR